MPRPIRRAKPRKPVHQTARILVPRAGGLLPQAPFNVSLNIRPKPWFYAPHAHTFHEIAYVAAGAAKHTLHGKTTRLGPGSVYILPPGVFHTVDIEPELSWYNLLITVEALPDLMTGLWSFGALVRLFHRPGKDLGHSLSFTMTPEERAPFELILGSHANLKHERDSGAAPMKRHLFIALLIHLARCVEAREGKAPGKRGDGEVIRAIGLIEELLDRGAEATPEALTRALKLSADLLSTRFRRMVGCTLSRYLLRRKIQKSLLLLGDGERVMDLSRRFGFADAAHFSRTFKEHIGLSPREYLERRGDFQVAEATAPQGTP